MLALRDTASNSRAGTKSTSGSNVIAAASDQLFQEALKLMQDSVLPVRAQGLGMLDTLLMQPEGIVDPVRRQDIIGIMLHTLADDDSYLYMADISALVHAFEKGSPPQAVDLIGQLCSAFSASNLGQQSIRDLDKRLRVGEVLDRIVAQSGPALAIFGAYLQTLCNRRA